MNRRELLLGGIALGFLALPETAAAEAERFPISRSDIRKVPAKFRRRKVRFDTDYPPGTIVVDTASKYLYFLTGNGSAIRYGIGVGRQGFSWSGTAVIRRKAKWPTWTPPAAMVERDEFAAQWAGGMPGGPKNPLGARALYLYQGNRDTLYRIHGTFAPSSIGKAVSSGCIRMINADVADLYDRVRLGAQVVVLQRPTGALAEAPVTRKRRTIQDIFE
ncbi:MAG: L,D-transpeptidase [Alphaproteobacteria bacterium]|nr:L,D-transpeptidase [Alphaproteobacteria bacterium]